MTTSVCIKVSNLRKLKRPFASLREWMKDPNNIYVGRQGRIFIDGKIFHYKGSKWQNPYKVTKEMPLKKSLRMYLSHLFRGAADPKGSSKSLISQIEELRGKTLGCFCEIKHKKIDGKYVVMCHAQLLADILEKCDLGAVLPFGSATPLVVRRAGSGAGIH